MVLISVVHKTDLLQIYLYKTLLAELKFAR